MGQVQVISGANNDAYPFAGLTVGAVRSSLENIINIGANDVATLNGQRVDEDTVLPADSTLSFSPTLAQKG